jgi:response regulator NasT
MTAFDMKEPDAFKWIQRAAMDNRMTMKQVAERIIEENLPGSPA